MIKTARQLKDKIRNMSGGNSQKSQALLRITLWKDLLKEFLFQSITVILF